MVLWEIITKHPPVRGHLREVRDDEAPPGVQKLLEDCINIDVSVALKLPCCIEYALVSACSLLPHIHRWCRVAAPEAGLMVIRPPVPLQPQVSQRPDAAEIVERVQASTPGLTVSSSRSLGSAAFASLPTVAAGVMPTKPLQQPLGTIDGSSGTAGSGGVHDDPLDSAVSNPFAAQYELLRLQLQEQTLPPAAGSGAA